MPKFHARTADQTHIGYEAVTPWVGHLRIGNGNAWTTHVLLWDEWKQLVAAAQASHDAVVARHPSTAWSPAQVITQLEEG